eukprot:TRINITY_DN103780_c0_g1_i1.p1 TRINITY_DN103780_c0_g1~~TRINITY_DN103780_c0_g1_i1.p1  ORF type:complete len:1405 (-),score=286.18 TRINITY_DN103780_c0_g1_i1:262-4416(-)
MGAGSAAQRRYIDGVAVPQAAADHSSHRSSASNLVPVKSRAASAADEAVFRSSVPNVVTVKPRLCDVGARKNDVTHESLKRLPEAGVFAAAFEQATAMGPVGFDQKSSVPGLPKVGQSSWQAKSAQEITGAGGSVSSSKPPSAGGVGGGVPSSKPPSAGGAGGAVSSSKPASAGSHRPNLAKRETSMSVMSVTGGQSDRSGSASVEASRRHSWKISEDEVGTTEKGNFHVGQTVWLAKLTTCLELNGQEATVMRWDVQSMRWVVRLRSTGEDKRIRVVNLSTIVPAKDTPAAGGGAIAAAAAAAADGEKDMEHALLQSNWSAIYKLFFERFGIEVLSRLERGYAVKAAVEMTLSIVSKCFALLRSDPNGRLHCTPLHIAALQNSTEAAQVIVRDLPHVVAQSHVSSNSTLCPLHIAILCGSYEIAELLLDGKASPNVRTLHDVSPLHLAATNSKELCQLLISSGADPGLRDVMGSTPLHYAAAFKQHDALEVIVTGSQMGERLCSECDQKRVTPLHVTCALYGGIQDLVSPMLLLASGAKPWHADVSGATSRDVVPWSQGSELMRFFESCGDNSQTAAKDWLDDFFLARGDGRGDSAEDPWEEGEYLPDGMKAQPASEAPETNRSSEADAAAKAAAEQIEKLQADLDEYRSKCAELEPLVQQLQHSQEKIAMLEQNAKNQQQIFQDQRELLDTARSQYQIQLQDLKERHMADREAWERRSQAQLDLKIKEVRQEEQSAAEMRQREVQLRLAELQAELQEAEQSAQHAARQAELATTMTRGLNLRRSSTGIREEERELERRDKQELKEQEHRVEELETELSRLEHLCEQERLSAEKAAKQVQEFKSAARIVSAKYGIRWREDVLGVETLQGIDAELARLGNESIGKDAEAKAIQQQVMQLRDEIEALRLAKLEVDSKCQQLQVEKQQLENNVNAHTLQLEAQLRDANLRNSQLQDEMRREAESYKSRAESAVALQPTVDRLKAQLAQLEVQFAEEQAIRKRMHNQIQDMKGNIRVFCRFRPLVAKEVDQGDVVVLRKTDAFTVDLRRPAPHNDLRNFQFDSIFDCGSTQDEVFADCRDLVQSAVDGYNVTIFAYGQTGAGKTHTMYGNATDPGLAPRSIHALFDVIAREQRRGNKTFALKAYMIEVYKQDIIDLLADPKHREQKSLQVKQDFGRGNMFVDGVSEHNISNPAELKALLAEGESRRHTRLTKMNASSSRSHLLLSIIIEGRVGDTGQVIYGKITLCDLAGSERPKKSEVTGDALKEAIEINKSLTALGDVIEALTKGSKVVPYRNSKLTMLMQDSLGGSAKTLMFVNCSPASSNCEESLTSMKWASRARHVTNDVKRNADSKEVARLKQVIAMMSQAQNAQEPLVMSELGTGPGLVS